MFSCEFCEIFKNMIFTEHVRETAFGFIPLASVVTSLRDRRQGLFVIISQWINFYTPWNHLKTVGKDDVVVKS